MLSPVLRSRVFATGLLAVTALIAPQSGAAPTDATRPPNVVLIFCDDLGYADIGPFGAKGYATPNLDRMAAEGIKFTDFYVAASVCSPSRAALLTGCYPQRVSIPNVLFPSHTIGINPDETTIPEALKARGYATACVGKWHLGHLPPFLPTKHGFDEFFGLPYSNDMSPDPKNNPSPNAAKYPPLPLMRNREVLETEPDQTTLTTRYTEESIRFIEKHKDGPFFLYLPHSMPHVPLYVSDKFKGKTDRGLYGDVIAEIDWSVGQILGTLKRLNLDENTLVVFTSDNGPWAIKKDHAGSAEPLKGSKGGSFEGGTREPFLARWPGHIPAGSVCKQPASAIDFLPTLAKLAGAELPQDRKIDGKDIWPLLAGDDKAQSPHDAIYYYQAYALRAVRSGKWKLHVALPGAQKTLEKPLLYDLESDIHEDTNVADQHPDVVERLTKLADQAREELGDTVTGKKGTGVRPPGQAPSL